MFNAKRSEIVNTAWKAFRYNYNGFQSTQALISYYPIST